MKTTKKTADKTQEVPPSAPVPAAVPLPGVAGDEASDQPTTVSPADPTTGSHNRAPRGPSIDWSDERLVTLVTTINQLKSDNGIAPTAEDVATTLQSNDQFSDIAALVTAQKVSSQLRAIRKRYPDRQIPVLARKTSGGRPGGRARDLSALEALLPPLDTGETQDGQDEEDAT